MYILYTYIYRYITMMFSRYILIINLLHVVQIIINISKPSGMAAEGVIGQNNTNHKKVLLIIILTSLLCFCTHSTLYGHLWT